MGSYKIVSFDGGGIRGVLSIAAFGNLYNKVPGLLTNVDLYAGTSAGGLNALALGIGKLPGTSSQDKGSITEYYNIHAKEFFQKNPLYTNGSFNCKYLNNSLRACVSKFLGDGKLEKNVFISTFQLTNEEHCWIPLIYTNAAFQNSPKYQSNLIKEINIKTDLVDLAMSTSAAPVYYPIYNNQYIDGGVFANNPGMMAIATALDYGYDLNDIYLLSIGTGQINRELVLSQGDKGEWGASQWLNPDGNPKTPLINAMMDGTSSTTDFVCQQLLNDRYKRLNIKLDKDYPLDDYQNVGVLTDFANNYPVKYQEQWDNLVNWCATVFNE